MGLDLVAAVAHIFWNHLWCFQVSPHGSSLDDGNLKIWAGAAFFFKVCPI